ncbi:hypothetical protein FE243_00910 [Aliarcobacter thereius]|uniref:restriction endonuclease subunit S n=1 Tax=Aliarcobacter thereius TaxID=544718 RepID=UPI0010FE355B|nr:restriction endonuclease subunit S [Aliarcobacter thereius]TLT08482.1 hypothetical protein FE243_00910 [Aliarcobacter thereius]
MAELYSLPNGWEWKKLEDVCGKDSSNISLKTIENDNGIYPIYGAKGLIKTISSYRREEPYIAIIKDGAGVGRVMICDEKSSIIATMQYLIPKNNVSLKFLFYFLSIIDFSHYINGATIPHIYYKDYKNNPFPLPPLEEQKRIVEKLDLLFTKIDKAIEFHQKNCEEADIFMASVLNDVFVELEEKYEKKQLNEIVIFGGKNISTLEYPNLIYFSLEDIETQTGKILNYKTVNESGVKGTAVSFDDNVVLYSKLRPYLNKVIVPNLEGCATTELVVLKPKDKLDKYFLASYLRSSNIVNFLNNDSMGAKMPRTNMKTFRNLDIPLPPLKTQQKVVAYLDEISNKIEKIKQIQKEKMQSLKELKASILDKAFKGEL